MGKAHGKHMTRGTAWIFQPAGTEVGPFASFDPEMGLNLASACFPSIPISLRFPVFML